MHICKTSTIFICHSKHNFVIVYYKICNTSLTQYLSKSNNLISQTYFLQDNVITNNKRLPQVFLNIEGRHPQNLSKLQIINETRTII